MIKVCLSCKQELPIDLFRTVMVKGIEKRQAKCKPCMREYQKAYYEANREHIQGVMKEWNKKNPEYINKWRTENSDKVKQYREAHKPRARERVKEQYWKDPESARLKSRQYKEANKEFVKRRKKEWNAESKEHLRMYYNKKTEQLSDSYIRNKLAANHKRERTLCSEDIPQDLVELKRLQLLIQRELRK